MTRRIEFIVSLVTPLFVAIGFAFAIFGPATYSYGTNWIDAASQSLWDVGTTSPGLLLFFAVMALGAAGIVVGTYLRTRGDGAAALTVLWGSAVILLVGTMMTLPGQNAVFVPHELHTTTPDSVNLGVYFIPAVGVAFLTALIESVIHHQPTRTGRQRPTSPA